MFGVKVAICDVRVCFGNFVSWWYAAVMTRAGIALIFIDKFSTVSRDVLRGDIIASGYQDSTSLKLIWSRIRSSYWYYIVAG